MGRAVLSSARESPFTGAGLRVVTHGSWGQPCSVERFSCKLGIQLGLLPCREGAQRHQEPEEGRQVAGSVQLLAAKALWVQEQHV